jgi:hypothetical protein
MQAVNCSSHSSHCFPTIRLWVSLTMISSRWITSITLADDQSFANLKTKLIQQGQQYATEALTYRKKIAELAVGFIKDGSVVSVGYNILKCLLRSLKDSHTLLFKSGNANVIARAWTETDLRSCSFLLGLTNLLNLFGSRSFRNRSPSSWPRVRACKPCNFYCC